MGPILVTGVPRSGNTWLARLLARSPGTALAGREPMNPRGRQYALGKTLHGWTRLTEPTTRQRFLLRTRLPGLEPVRLQPVRDASVGRAAARDPPRGQGPLCPAVDAGRGRGDRSHAGGRLPPSRSRPRELPARGVDASARRGRRDRRLVPADEASLPDIPMSDDASPGSRSRDDWRASGPCTAPVLADAAASGAAWRRTPSGRPAATTPDGPWRRLG